MLCIRTGLSRLTTDEKLKEAFTSFGQLVEGNHEFFFSYYEACFA